jgi:hypothetical protein
LRAFIVRPFGEKTFGKGQVTVNFDDVEKMLIQPALRALNIDGTTTSDILEAGNIRYDMFQRLLVCELVIADLSIHNANVFYELGIRHALRDKRTFLLYSSVGDEKVPFDLQTDRYLSYDHRKPGESCDALIAGLRRTLASDMKDSPVFTLLPTLRSQDPGRFVVVPVDFRNEVDLAETRGRAGVLALLGAEVSGLLWEREGLRLVARAQVRRNFPSGATDTWNRLLRIDPDDCEANLELGSIYQAAGELDKSNTSLQSVLANSLAEPKQRAEAHALKARNAVEYWRRNLSQVKPEAKATEALLSPRLEESYTQFRRAFEEDLRAYMFGTEALARLTVWVSLAARLKDAWEDSHASAIDAARELDDLRSQVTRLAASVELSLEVAERQAGTEKSIDIRMARAQLTLLTSDRKERVRSCYVQALEYASPADISELRRFLGGFDDLDVLTSSVQMAVKLLEGRPGTSSSAEEASTRVLLYRGYGRSLLASERKVRDWIREQIESELAAAGAGKLMAIAGGGCGGEILLHEICQDLRIPSHVYMPFAREQYIARYVQCDDPKWVERFGKLATTVPLSFLQASPEMPNWLKDRSEYTFLQRWNSWMLWVARTSAPNVTLVAICDEAKPDQEGVLDLVLQARQTGVKVITTNPAMLAAQAQDQEVTQ